jgi:hypothetical protein
MEPGAAGFVLFIVTIVAVGLGLFSWIPCLSMISQKSLMSRQKSLTYPKME